MYLNKSFDWCGLIKLTGLKQNQLPNGKHNAGIAAPNRVEEDNISMEDFDDAILPEDLHSESKRQHDDYGHMRYGKRDFDDYGHMRFGR